MRPDDALNRERVAQLYSRGEWEAAETLLRALASANGEDMGVRFQLATLLALRARAEREAPHQEVIDLYDACAAQQWALPLCLNNRGVVLAQAGQALAAVTDLRTASHGNGGYGPALYNLGMICQLVAEAGGGVPQLLVDQEVLGADEAAEAAARRLFELSLQAGLGEIPPGANGGSHARPSPLVQPLYLWSSDLPASLGWMLSEKDANLEEAKQHLREGEARYAQEDFRGALELFRQAAEQAHELGPRVWPLRNRARMGYARAARAEIRALRSDRQWDAARDALKRLLNEIPHLPDRSFALTLISSEVADLLSALRASERSGLQLLVGQIGDLVEEYPRLYAATLEALAQADGDGTGQTRMLGAREPEQLYAEARDNCEGVLRRELNGAAQAGDRASLEGLLALPDTRWMGPEVLARLRRDAYRWLARQRLDTLHRAELTPDQRLDYLREAREAAAEAGDEELVQEIVRLGAAGAGPAGPDPAMRAALHEQRYFEVLELYAERTREAAPTAELASLRDVALQAMVQKLDRARREGSPQAAYDIASRLARLEPTDEAVVTRFHTARREWVAELVALARVCMEQNDWEEAKRRLETAAELEPASDEVLEARALLTERRTLAGGEQAKDDYNRANEEFTWARGTRDVAGAARAYQTMWGLDEGAPRTGRAANWLYRELLRELNGRGGTPEAARAVREMTGYWLDLEGSRDDVRRLREALDRAEQEMGAKTHQRADKRRRAVDEAIEDADEAISRTPPEPLEALRALAANEHSPSQDQKRRIDEIRDYAIGILRGRLEAAAALGEPGEQRMAELLDGVRDCAPPAAATLEDLEVCRTTRSRAERRREVERLSRIRDYPALKAQVDRSSQREDPEVQRMLELARLHEVRQQRSYRALQAEVARSSHRDDPEVRRLLEDARGSLSWLDRLRMRLLPG